MTLDFMFYTPQGLGMVVTGTLPVFNLTMKGNSQVIKPQIIRQIPQIIL